MPVNAAQIKTFLSPLEAYKYAYDNGLNFKDNMYIEGCNSFKWKEAFVNEPVNNVPCLYVFKNLQETFVRLQYAKDKNFNSKAVNIHRAYSSVEHNKSAGSVAILSTHIEGRAVDYDVAGLTAGEVIKRMSINPKMRVELGTEKKGYCHCDCGDPYHPSGMVLKPFSA